MPNFNTVRLTNKGIQMLAEGQMGGRLTFTKIKVGDGKLLNADQSAHLKDLIAEVNADISIVGHKILDNGTVNLKARLKSGEKEFYMREIGIFARMNEGSEHLYAYAYCGEYADFIPKAGGATTVVQDLNLFTLIGNSSEVYADISAEIGVERAEYDEHRDKKVLDHPNGSVTTEKIADGSINTAKLADSSVTTAKIVDKNITTGKLDDNSVTTAKITNKNVTSDKLSDGSVSISKIADNSVTTAKITDKNVTSAKLADASVTTSKLADNSVTTAKITNKNVTTDKLADKSVTSEKLADSVHIPMFGVCDTVHGNNAKVVTCPNFKLYDGARIMVIFSNGNSCNYLTLNVNNTGAIMAWFPIGTSRGYNNELISKMLVGGCAYEFVYQGGSSPKWVYCGATNIPADNCITADHIKSGAVTGAKIASNTITKDKLASTVLSTIEQRLVNLESRLLSVEKMLDYVEVDVSVKFTQGPVYGGWEIVGVTGNWRTDTAFEYVIDNKSIGDEGDETVYVWAMLDYKTQKVHVGVNVIQNSNAENITMHASGHAKFKIFNVVK